MSAKDELTLKKISNFLASGQRDQNLWAINELKGFICIKSVEYTEFQGTVNLERLKLFYEHVFRNFVYMLSNKSDSLRMKIIEISKGITQSFFYYNDCDPKCDSLDEGMCFCTFQYIYRIVYGKLNQKLIE
jgi:hypothetical protein